jgi:hypothetical protein
MLRSLIESVEYSLDSLLIQRKHGSKRQEAARRMTTGSLGTLGALPSEVFGNIMGYIDPSDAFTQFILYSEDVAWWTVHLKENKDYQTIIARSQDPADTELRIKSKRVRRVIVEAFPDHFE